MQTTVPFGSSLDLAVSSKCSLVSLSPRTRKCGERGAGPLQQQLRCGTKLQKPFFVGDCHTDSLRISSCSTNSGLSFPLRPPRDPQTRALARFFVNGRKWGQKDPPNPQNPQHGVNGAVMNQSWVQSKGQSLLQKSAWVAAIVLMGGGALYGQGKARAYIERTFLPPAAAMVGQYFGREIQLGKVQRLTPLGITLGPCSVGAHDEEFSCAEIPGVEFRVLPVASLRKGQLVVDAVIAEPHILVSQKEDWTWLGIPLVSEEKKFMRHSSEPNLDSRTKVRRLAREEMGGKMAIERKRAARDAAKRGYKLPGDATKNDIGIKSRGSEKQTKSLDTELEDSENEEGIDTNSSYLGVDEADGIKAGQHVEERLTEADEANTGFELRNSVLGAKVWIDTNMLKPVKRRVLRRWTKQGLHAISKAVMQRKNLDRSAAAARAYFQKLDWSHFSGTGGRGASGSVDSNDISALPSRGNSQDVGWTGSRFDDNKKGAAAPRSFNIEKVEVSGSGDNGGGFLLSPFSQANRPTLPPMSLSSSWGARGDRKGEGKVRPVLPNLKLQIEDAVHYKRGIEQVNFRKINGMKPSLKSLGTRAFGRERRGSTNKKSDHMSSGESVNLDIRMKMSDNLSTSESSETEGGSSQVTLDSVKEALVQAIRERQEKSGGTDRNGLRSSNQHASKASSSVQQVARDSLVSKSSEGDPRMDLRSQLVSDTDAHDFDEKKTAIYSLSESSLSGKSGIPGFLGEDVVSELIQNEKNIQGTGRTRRSIVGSGKSSGRHVTKEGGTMSNSVSKGLVSAHSNPRNTQQDAPEHCALPEETHGPSYDSHMKGALELDDGGHKEEEQQISKKAGQTMESRLLDQAKTTTSWTPIALNSVYFKDGTLMLLAFGDREPRVMEKATGQVKFGNSYDQINVRVTGRPKEFRTQNVNGDGGKLFVKVAIDLAKQEWHLKVRGRHLFAPLFERLLEVPLDWSDGRASGEVHAWMLKDDPFPSFGGRLDVRGLDFGIWDAPAPFKGVNGTLFFQGQRLFFHNASGLYGEIPLQVSGDMDLNPDDGEYRLSCQVSGVEANSLMKTLKAQPPPFPLAGALKAVVHCRGPLDAPIFEGSAELAGKHVALVYEGPHSVATQAIKENEQAGAVAAYDRIPFASASASFTFNTDDCMAELYGVRAAPVGGGEIRGAGNLWICPEGEVDPSAVNVDCSGKMATDPLLHSYSPAGMNVSSISFGTMHGEAKIRGALMMPVFDIKWDTPEAQGSFDGAHGDVHISREVISLNSSACTYDLSTKIHTLHPPIIRAEVRTFEYKPAPPPIVEGLDLDLKVRGFDVMGLAPLSSPLAVSSHMKVTGNVKFNGKVPKPTAEVLSDDKITVNSKNEEELDSSVAPANGISELVGEVSLSGLKLNQLLVAPHLTGSLEVSPSSFKVHTTGTTDEHLHVLVSKNLLSTSEPPGPDVFEQFKGASFSLLRGQLRTDFHYQPGHSAKVEIRNLQLDELELASLRGAVQKADLALNFQKRRGQGNLSVRRPRGSGIQGESLDIAARWSGDVITLDKSVLEQENSRYELQGEYVLPSLRDRSVIEKGKQWEKAMGGQLGQMITSMGRWRLRLDVPSAEVSEMLPVARLLSRSSDPAVVSRSKELFLQGVRSAGLSAENLKEQLEYIRQSKGMAAPEGSPESIPLPGLAELRGAWHGTLEASGGGDGDTYAEFDLRGDEWEWGSYKTRKVVAIGDYRNNDGLRLQKFFIQKDTATLHADGTMLGPKPNLHFAVLNFPVDLVPPLLHAIQSSTPEPFLSPASRPYSTPIKGILYMEGDLRGTPAKPQCDVQIRLLDGAVGGVSLGKAEMAASLTSANRLAFNAVVEPVSQTGHVRIQGSLPMGPGGLEEHEVEVNGKEKEQHMRAGNWGRERNRDRKDEEQDDKDESLEKGGEEGWEVRLAESLKALDAEFLESDAVQVDAAVKDGGMMLLTAISPGFQWIQGNADIKLQVRGTVQQPSADGTASFHKVGISSPVLPRPVSNLGGTITVKNNQVFVEGLEGRVGRRGLVEVKGQLPLRSSDSSTPSDAIEVKAEHLEVRARNVYSGQVNSNLRVMGSFLEPEVTGMIKLSHGEAYLSQEKGTSSSSSTISSSPPGGGYSWMAAAASAGRRDAEIFPLPEQLGGKPPGYKEEQKDDRTLGQLPPVDVRLRCLKLLLGPELRMVYPLILNFAVSGELEFNGFADSLRIKPKGTLTFENGDVNLVATQVRLNKDYPNRAKFEPEHGLDPTLDLALIGADWQLKVQGRARNWQDNIVVSSTRTGEQDALTRTEAARVFESQLAESLLEGDGQLAFKKLAAATVDTLMPRIETKGEFGQARWRLVSAPQIPNLLSLDPTTDPFKSLANLSFGAEVEVQVGKHIQASVARRIKESEVATEWTLLYQLNSKMRVLFSSIPSVDNRLLFEFSATSQN